MTIDELRAEIEKKINYHKERFEETLSPFDHGSYFALEFVLSLIEKGE